MAVVTTTANGPQTGGGGGTWGSITGTLADQLDVQAALDAKAADAAVVKLTGVQTVAGAKTFSDILAVSNNTASSSTITGCITAAGGVGIVGALNTAGTVRHTNVTDATSAAVPGAVGLSGGMGIAKKLFVGTGFTLEAGNVLVTSGNIGVDSGVSGNITNCPTNVFANFFYSKTGYALAANSATTGLTLVPDSGTSASFKNGATALVSVTTTQNYFLNRLHLGNGENNILNFGANTGFDSNNAAAVVVYQFDTSGRDNWVFCARVYAVMRRTDSGTEYGQIAKSLMWSREGGTVTVRGAIQDIHPDNYVTMAPTGITQDGSGNFLRIIFTGEAGKRIEGNFIVNLTMHST